jgi:hypothetical protein
MTVRAYEQNSRRTCANSAHTALSMASGTTRFVSQRPTMESAALHAGVLGPVHASHKDGLSRGVEPACIRHHALDA